MSTTFTYRKGNEYVKIVYLQRREGALVGEVQYTLNGVGIDRAGIGVRLMERYGKPAIMNGGDLLWCVVIDGRCDISSSEMLEAQDASEGGVYITLSASRKEAAVSDTELRADLSAAHASGQQTSF